MALNASAPLRKRVRKNPTQNINLKLQQKPYSQILLFSIFMAGGHSFDVIMFDVDNKDSSLGMSGPPPAFVETLFLQKVSNLLSPRGTAYLTLIFHDI